MQENSVGWNGSQIPTSTVSSLSIICKKVKLFSAFDIDFVTRKRCECDWKGVKCEICELSFHFSLVLLHYLYILPRKCSFWLGVVRYLPEKKCHKRTLIFLYSTILTLGVKCKNNSLSLEIYVYFYLLCVTPRSE